MGAYTYLDKKIIYGFKKGTEKQLVKSCELPIGAKCGAICVLCGNELTNCEDKDGTRYFMCGHGSCKSLSGESYEHIVTKYLVRNAKQITIPELNLSHIHDGTYKYSGMERFKLHGPVTLNFDKIEVEQNITIEGKLRRADLVGYINTIHGLKSIIIEITAYHEVDTQKIREYALTNSDVIEVLANLEDIEKYTCRYMASITADAILQLLFHCCIHRKIDKEMVDCDLYGLGGCSLEECKKCPRLVYIEKDRYVQCYDKVEAKNNLAYQFKGDEPKRVDNFRNNLDTAEKLVNMLSNSMIGNYSSEAAYTNSESTTDKVEKLREQLEEARNLLEKYKVYIERLEQANRKWEENFNKGKRTISNLNITIDKLKDTLSKKKEALKLSEAKNKELAAKIKAIRDILRTSKKDNAN